jgi:hypothetical protein
LIPMILNLTFLSSHSIRMNPFPAPLSASYRSLNK